MVLEGEPTNRAVGVLDRAATALGLPVAVAVAVAEGDGSAGDPALAPAGASATTELAGAGVPDGAGVPAGVDELSDAVGSGRLASLSAELCLRKERNLEGHSREREIESR